MPSVDRRLEIAVEAVLVRGVARLLVEHAAQDRAFADSITARAHELCADARVLLGIHDLTTAD